MTGKQKRAKLVEQMFQLHLRTILVPRLHQQREDVLSIFGRLLPLLDFLGQVFSQRTAGLFEAIPWPKSEKTNLSFTRKKEQGRRMLHDCGRLFHQRSNRLFIFSTKDDIHDNVQRDRGCDVEHRNGSSVAVSIERTNCDALHGVNIGLHALTMKHRHDQLALALVGLPVELQH